MPDLVKKINQIMDLANQTEPDIIKVNSHGNKAAAVRARKNLQQIRELAQALRKEIQTDVNASKGK